MNLPHSLDELYRRKMAEFTEQHRRALPLTEMLVDRWEKAKLLGFGEGTSIYDNSLVFGDVSIGKDTWIGPYTLLDGHGAPLSIGSNCSISTGVQIYTHDSVKWAVTGGKADYEYGATTIGDNVYIAPNVVIAKGVTIGDHCIIGAGSLVNSDIPSCSVAFGTPAEVAGTIVFTDESKSDYTIEYHEP